MFCPWCGTHQDDSAVVCANCGKELPVSSNGNTTSSILDLGVKKSSQAWFATLLKSPKFLFAAAIAIVLALFVFFLLQPSSPKDVAEKFMRYMSSGNYTKAYSLLYKTDSAMLKEDRFVNAQQNLERDLGPIVEYRIDFREEERRIEQDASALIGDTEYLPSKRQDYLVTYRRAKMSEPEEFTLSMRNVSAGKRPKWRACVDEWYDSYSLSIPSGLKDCTVLVDGKEVTPKDGELSFNVFGGDRVEVSITGADIEPVKVVLDRRNTSKKFESLQVSNSLQTKLKKIVEGFNKADVAVGMDWNIDHYKPYVKEDTGFEWLTDTLWEKLVDQAEKMKEDNKKEQRELLEVKYDRAVLTEDNKARMRVTETWQSKTFDSSGEVVEEEEPHTIVWDYIFGRQSDGKWLILDTERIR